MSDKLGDYTLNLDRAAAYLLLNLLMQNGWSVDHPGMTYRAGQLMERPEFEFYDRPLPADRNAPPDVQKAAGMALEAWGKEPRPIAGVTEKQRDACKRCVEHAVKNGFGASTTLNRLIDVLGLAPTD